VMLEMSRNGLNLLGANPFSYRFVNGGIIFLAMYADSLKSRVRARRA
jgi:ribose/xylose/arabinose/galactoside ABC-type transport system permease subunit